MVSVTGSASGAVRARRVAIGGGEARAAGNSQLARNTGGAGVLGAFVGAAPLLSWASAVTQVA